MKPNREEVLRLLRGACDPGTVDPLDGKGEFLTITPVELERFAAAMYEAGAAAERAVSDKLLEALKETVNRLQFANMRVDCEAEIAAADSVIAEVEAMREKDKYHGVFANFGKEQE